MSTLEESLYTLVQAATGVTALIGTRCYPLALPQKPTLPAVRYEIVSAIPFSTHDAAGGLVRARVQVDSVAATYAGARALADTVRAAIDGHFSRSGVIRSILRENENPAYDDQTGQKVVSVDYMMMYKE